MTNIESVSTTELDLNLPAIIYDILPLAINLAAISFTSLCNIYRLSNAQIDAVKTDSILNELRKSLTIDQLYLSTPVKNLLRQTNHITVSTLAESILTGELKKIKGIGLVKYNEIIDNEIIHHITDIMRNDINSTEYEENYTMNKTVLQESDSGIIYRFDKIHSNLFEFYIEKTQCYKDKTHKYNIGVTLTANPKKSWVLKTIRGHKADAVKTLERIIRTGEI